MKNIINKIKTIAAIAVAGAATTSCSLDMLPLNQVVLESFWTDENDVQSVVNSCYVGMQENGFMNKVLVWSEVRSDNTKVGPDAETNTDLKNLMRGSILSTNGNLNWGPMYSVINRCNTVLKYAPEVHAKDPNYTDYDYNVNVAEVKFIRAYSYLILAKTFRNIPFSFEPSVDDTQDYLIPATPFEQVIDALIADIESCKDFPPYVNIAADGQTSLQQSTGRVTRPAMYALLAELYLWKASVPGGNANDYWNCIDACDFVLKFKIKQFEERSIDELRTQLNSLIDQEVYSMFKYPLLSHGYSQSAGQAAAEKSIFIDGNSFESIFEITYGENRNDIKNTDLCYMYGGIDGDKRIKQSLYAHDNVMLQQPTPGTQEYKSSKTDLFQTTTDVRSVLDFAYSASGNHAILKYVDRSPSFMNSALYDQWKPGLSTSSYIFESQTQNWIVYRMSDMLLMRAEAEIQLAGMMNQDATYDPATYTTERKFGSDLRNATHTELYNDAFNLILAVYARSNVRTIMTMYSNQYGKARPMREDFTQKYQFDDLLLAESRREFLFEGKRYYDLVRDARRSGDQKRFRTAISQKFGAANSKALNRLNDPWAMYLPISKQQLKVNPNLTQNPAYADEEAENKKN